MCPWLFPHPFQLPFFFFSLHAKHCKNTGLAKKKPQVFFQISKYMYHLLAVTQFKLSWPPTESCGELVFWQSTPIVCAKYYRVVSNSIAWKSLNIWDREGFTYMLFLFPDFSFLEVWEKTTQESELRVWLFILHLYLKMKYKKSMRIPGFEGRF